MQWSSHYKVNDFSRENVCHIRSRLDLGNWDSVASFSLDHPSLGWLLLDLGKACEWFSLSAIPWDTKPMNLPPRDSELGFLLY